MIFSIFIDGTSLSLDVSGSIEYKIMILKKEQEEEEEGNISPHSLGGGPLPAQLPVTRARRPPSPSGAWRAVTSATWPAAASSAATSCLMPRDWWWDGQRISVHMWSSVCLDYIETVGRAKTWFELGYIIVMHPSHASHWGEHVNSYMSSPGDM